MRESTSLKMLQQDVCQNQNGQLTLVTMII
jgi:hypothetical protein